MKLIIGKFILTQEQVKSGGKLNFCLFKCWKLSHFMRNRWKKNYFVGYKVNFSKEFRKE